LAASFPDDCRAPFTSRTRHPLMLPPSAVINNSYAARWQGQKSWTFWLSL